MYIAVLSNSGYWRMSEVVVYMIGHSDAVLMFSILPAKHNQKQVVVVSLKRTISIKSTLLSSNWRKSIVLTLEPRHTTLVDVKLANDIKLVVRGITLDYTIRMRKHTHDHLGLNTAIRNLNEMQLTEDKSSLCSTQTWSDTSKIVFNSWQGTLRTT